MESCKTPVDPKIKPDPKEKDLSSIPVRQPALQLSPMSCGWKRSSYGYAGVNFMIGTIPTQLGLLLEFVVSVAIVVLGVFALRFFLKRARGWLVLGYGPDLIYHGRVLLCHADGFPLFAASHPMNEQPAPSSQPMNWWSEKIKNRRTSLSMEQKELQN
jgi:hypothetical protein